MSYLPGYFLPKMAFIEKLNKEDAHCKYMQLQHMSNISRIKDSTYNVRRNFATILPKLKKLFVTNFSRCQYNPTQSSVNHN